MSYCSIRLIASAWPPSVKCARPVSPTYSLQCWEITGQLSRKIRRATRPARHRPIMKEQPHEYSMERGAGFLRRAESGTCSPVADSANVLVVTTRIVGEPKIGRASCRERVE